MECHQSTLSLSIASSTVPNCKTPIVYQCGESSFNKKQSLMDLQKQLLIKEMQKMEMEVMELKKKKLVIHLLKLKKEKLVCEQ